MDEAGICLKLVQYQAAPGNYLYSSLYAGITYSKVVAQGPDRYQDR